MRIKDDEKWQSVDWSKQNSVIAKELGHEYYTVQYVRNKLGKPKSSCHHAHPKQPDRIRKTLADFAKLDFANTTDAELARQTGYSREYMRQVRKRLGLPSTMTVHKKVAKAPAAAPTEPTQNEIPTSQN